MFFKENHHNGTKHNVLWKPCEASLISQAHILFPPSVWPGVCGKPKYKIMIGQISAIGGGPSPHAEQGLGRMQTLKINGGTRGK